MPFYATDRDTQLAYWDRADADHYEWQTGPTYFAETERDLVGMTGLGSAQRLLEIGCGEGANLFHLGARKGWVGIDFSVAKLAFARGRMPGVRVTAADATRLPFADASFDAVLIRDVLHHVGDRQAVVDEAARVLLPGGTLAAVEPNRGSPLIVAQAMLVKEERAVLRSTARLIGRELADAGLTQVKVTYAQPLPMARIAQHPKIGLGALAATTGAKRVLSVAERLSARLVPRKHWMYLVAGGVKPQ